MNGFLRPIRSESQPETIRSAVAVHSATPSITPRLATEALSVPVTNAGSTGTTISEEMSVRSDVHPSTRTLRFTDGSGRAATAGAGDDAAGNGSGGGGKARGGTRPALASLLRVADVDRAQALERLLRHLGVRDHQDAEVLDAEVRLERAPAVRHGHGVDLVAERLDEPGIEPVELDVQELGRE